MVWARFCVFSGGLGLFGMVWGGPVGLVSGLVSICLGLVMAGLLGWSGVVWDFARFCMFRMVQDVWCSLVCGQGWSGLVSAYFGMVWWVWGGKRRVKEPSK